jgi:signal transduction histidine kinase
MTQSPTSQHEERLLHLIAYTILASVAIIALRHMLQEGVRWEIPALLLAAFGVLMARIPPAGAPPTRAYLYLGTQTALVTALMILSSEPTLFPTLHFILSAQAMMLLPDKRGWLWIGLFALLTGLILSGGGPETLVSALLYAAGYFFFGVFAHALARANLARQESQQLLAELRKAHTQLQGYSARVEELAVAEERNRLAREMHDTLGHRLTVAAVQLEGAQRLIPQEPERATAMVATGREQLRDALADLRQTVATLRIPLEADLQLRKSLRQLASGFEKATGIEVHLVSPDEMPPLPRAHRLALYRAAQEALTNVQRHAQAEQAWLTLMPQKDQIVLVVSDNGVGFPAGPAAETNFGLRGLQERVLQLGGELILETRAGGGAQLRLSLPLAEAPAGE